MAPHLRIQVRDDSYHVMSRGNGGDVIYRTDEDRRRFFGQVAESPESFGTEIQAFVLIYIRRTGDGTMAVATRHLGRRLEDVVREVPGSKEVCGGGAGDSPVLAPGVKRPGIEGVTRRLRSKSQICKV